MTLLVCERPFCKTDFAVLTDDPALAASYTALHLCDPEPDFSKRDLSNELMLDAVFRQLGEERPKPVCCTYYSAAEACLLYITPESRTIRRTALQEGFSPLQMIENLMYLTLIPQDGILGLHGAAVAKGNTAFLLLAETMAGKSTLTAFFCMRGFEYLTDDEIYISEESLLLRPVYKPLSLRPAADAVLKNACGADADFTVLDKFRAVRGTCSQYDQYKIGAVVFLEGYGSDTPYFTKMDARSGFSALLKGQLSAAGVGAEHFASVQTKYRALASLSNICYKMRYSDLWMAETYLRSLRI